MVMHPETYLEDYRRAGAKKIVFHYEATPSPQEVISRIKSLGIMAGVAVNPETPISAITPLTGRLDSVLFLSVNPGFYGARFIPEVLDKIAAFRSVHADGAHLPGNRREAKGRCDCFRWACSQVLSCPPPA